MENLSQAKNKKKQIANLLASTISKNSSLQHYPPKFQAIKMQKEKKNLWNSRQTTQKNTTNRSHC